MSEQLIPNEVVNEGRYEYFTNACQREQLLGYTYNVSKYLHDNNVPNMVLLDRGARPFYIAVRECWRQLYPDEEMPGLFFINPKGFVPTEELSQHKFKLEIIERNSKDDVYDIPTTNLRSSEDVANDVNETYHDLVKDKDKPLLLFDTCVHYGRSLGWSKAGFANAGFQNIVTGCVNPATMPTRATADCCFSPKTSEKDCFPFGEDRMVNKNLDRVLSRRNPDKDERDESILLRKEIQKIIRENIREYIDDVSTT